VFEAMANRIEKDEEFKKGFALFLNSIIGGRNGLHIESIHEVRTELSLPADDSRKRTYRLDLVVVSSVGDFYLVEIQLYKLEHIVPKMIQYLGRHLSDRAAKGFTDYSMPKYALIGLIDYSHRLFAGEPNYHLYTTMLIDNAQNKRLTEQLQFHLVSLHRYIELGHAPASGDELAAWMHYFAYGYHNEEEKRRLFGMSESVKSLDRNYQQVVVDPELARKAQQELMLIQELNTQLRIERHEGLEEGLSKGREEGREEERVAVARNALAKGYDLADIAELTGLSVEEIAKLKPR